MPPVDHIPDDENTLKILLTTDNHVGYLENDPVRGDDLWRSFQEITYMAKTRDVDMVVQGGDLFHVSKPLKKSLLHVIQALRLNCMGDRPCELELLSDPAPALRAGDVVNYEDPNINVSIPVFAISGNHDDATGEGLLSPLDVLATTGLINYFGDIPRLDKICVTPLVFQKGFTKLALYGINNMRDERLQRIMRNGDVTFQKPELASDFFNLLCLHQNHHRHSLTSYVPEDFLPSFLDFVLWGHEHECIPFPQYNPTTGFDTLQAGSSVATSLCQAEAAPKHVFLMKIRGKDYSLEPIPLSTVRPFIIKDVCLKDEHFIEGPASKADIASFLNHLVESMIGEACAGVDNNMLPLVRLRVDQTGNYEVENARRFSNRYVGKIANVNDILLYHKKKADAEPRQTAALLLAPSTVSENVSIQHILKQSLTESLLHLIPEDSILEATKKFIEQDDKQIFSDFVQKTITTATAQLQKINIDETEFHAGDDATMKKSFRQLLNKLRYDSKRKPLDDVPVANVAEKASVTASSIGSDDDDFVPKPSAPKPRRKPASKAKSAEVVQVADSDSDEYVPEKPVQVPAKRSLKAAPKRAVKKRATALDDLMSLG